MSGGPRDLFARLREAGRAAAEAFRGAPIAQTKLEGAGGLAQGPGATAAGEGGTAIGTVHGDVYVGPHPGDPMEALTIYRRVLAQTSGRLPLRGLDIGTADAGRAQEALSLAKVYVDLDTTMWVEQPGVVAPPRRERVRSPGSEKGPRPLGALEATIAQRRLVLLGDPGGGKSTFVNHLAHCLPCTVWSLEASGWPICPGGRKRRRGSCRSWSSSATSRAGYPSGSRARSRAASGGSSPAG